MKVLFLQCVLPSPATWGQHWADHDGSLSPQVSDSLQPPEQEAALLLKAEGLLLLQRRLLPAPHALLVPSLPPQHKHTLRAHPLAQRSRSVYKNIKRTLWQSCSVTLTLCASDLSVSDSVGYCRGLDFLMDVNYAQYLWDARQAIITSHRFVCLTFLKT